MAYNSKETQKLQLMQKLHNLSILSLEDKRVLLFQKTHMATHTFYLIQLVGRGGGAKSHTQSCDAFNSKRPVTRLDNYIPINQKTGLCDRGKIYPGCV